MTSPEPSESPDSLTLDAAAQWRARMSADGVTERDRAAFQAWMAESPDHRAAWARAERAWTIWDEADAHPAMTALRVEASQSRRPPRAWVGAALAAGLCGVVLVLAGGRMITGRPATPTTTVTAFSTPVGQVRQLALADGTAVTLDADSAIKVAFDGRVRNVELVRGRAQFAVAHDKAHPFVVTAQGRTVTALGTRFDVERGPAAVTVTLIEGRVAVRDLVSAQVRQATLAPGDRLTAADRGPWTRRTVDLAQVAQWSAGRLVFADETLDVVAAEMNRYSPQKLRLEGDGLGATKVSGVFQAGDPDALARGLEAAGAARIVRRGAGDIVLGAPRG